jgi:branched-chain amino acid transport system substrate-binding protein
MKWLALVAALAVAGLVAGLLLRGGDDGDDAPPAATRAEGDEVEAVVGPTCGDLEYGGDGEPGLVVAQLTELQGPDRAVGIQQTDAARLALQQHGWRAGPWRVAYVSCDSGTQGNAGFDFCAENARELARDEDVVALVSATGSGCTVEQLEALAAADDVPPAVVSGTATFPCLTHEGPGCQESEPERYSFDGRPIFARVVADEDAEAAALAELAAQEGLRRVFVLHGRDAYGAQVAAAFTAAAEAAGVEVVGTEDWDAGAIAMHGVGRAEPDAVLLAGVGDPTVARLIREKVRVLGPNDGAVRLLGSDGLLRPALANLPAAEGLLVASPGLPVERLPERGRAFAVELGGGIQPESMLTAQAVEVLLEAIARSDGTRAGLLDALFATKMEDGLIGDVALDEHGDPTPRRVTIYRAVDGRFRPDRTIDPGDELVEAAAGAR